MELLKVWFLRRIQKKMALPTVSRDLVAALISLFCSDDLRSLPKRRAEDVLPSAVDDGVDLLDALQQYLGTLVDIMPNAGLIAFD
jgi:hypothetical protein